jgi:hypothetical protein
MSFSLLFSLSICLSERVFASDIEEGSNRKKRQSPQIPNTPTFLSYIARKA